ncbi:titin isoform X2 [Tribolium madens]|uniref:titin isoform X2 n=1 Tax=Tribolium madens TaxID=41895 RepID=UPI001CF73B7F|nr:titin isoform X2 [Tribolium madens]
MSVVPGSTHGGGGGGGGVNPSRRQKRMGPAPFASFEDLSDELESPEDKNPAAGSVVRLPGIREDATPIDHPGISLLGAMPLTSPQKLTPRIDISRASSSSHHDSRDSTPEHEAPKLSLGFREEGALDLRSSTEELDFHDPQDTKKKETHQRKDSQSSEIGLLCISGRTSRLSSIGSQGSGQSRLSVISNQSGLSRSPSPHKMLLETSFCGTKPPENKVCQKGTKVEAEVLEKVLLARKQDPTQAVLAEGIAVVPPPKPKRVPKTDITIKVDEPQPPPQPHNQIPRKFVAKSGVEYIYIPLKGPLPQPETTKPKLREVKSATIQPNTKEPPPKPKPKSASPSPQYIRIKLKPDHMYDSTVPKPDTLDLKPKIESPKPQLSKTPSPSLSRKSSFASLFRSPESPPGCKRKTGSESLRERSKGAQQKSVFSRFRKKGEKNKDDLSTSSSEILPNFDTIAKVEFKFNDNSVKKHELESDSIRIPLHSPTYYEDRTIVVVVDEKTTKTSQETAIEVNRIESNTINNSSEPKRQSSTSSENVVFSTNLGNNNEIFSTKLPKEPDLSSAPEDVSSESERDSEAEVPKKKDLDLKLDLEFVEPERKELVLQDSYDDELPYVPTTLPQERSAALPIVPIKQRSTFEMKTCPIERPRSTTPINPSCLEEYCEDVITNITTIEKLKISLPRHESVEKTVKSPRKPSNTPTTTNWFEFAEKGIHTGRRSSLTQDETPPPLPPKGVQKEWINFEEIPERRKAPKRIQTLPSRGHIEVAENVDNVVYNYVNPEECKCECHEMRAKKGGCGGVQEDELPLLDDEDGGDRLKLDVAIADRRSIVSDSSVDLSATVEPPEANGSVKLRTPFTSDLGVSSNRSSIVSQDEPESPDSGSPNAFPKSLL